MTDSSETLDHEVLKLRRAGQAFARISRTLELKRPTDAQRAFQRAVLRLPEVEQQAVRLQESSRLDRLAKRVTDDSDASSEDRTRRLAAIERLRGLLTPASA